MRTICTVNSSASTSSHTGGRGPLTLLVGVVLAAVEGTVLAGYGVAEALFLSGDRLTMGLTTAVFFLAYGVGLFVVAWAAWRLAAWARAPLVMAQLIQLGVAWSFRGGSTTPAAAVLAVVALVALASLLHPDTTRVLVGDRR